MGAPRGRIEKFTRLVGGSLRRGVSVELDAIGNSAMWNSLRALAAGGASVEFQIFWVSLRNRKLQQRISASHEPLVEHNLNWCCVVHAEIVYGI